MIGEVILRIADGEVDLTGWGVFLLILIVGCVGLFK